MFAAVNIAITAVSPNARPDAKQVLETTALVEVAPVAA